MMELIKLLKIVKKYFSLTEKTSVLTSDGGSLLIMLLDQMNQIQQTVEKASIRFISLRERSQ